MPCEPLNILLRTYVHIHMCMYINYVCLMLMHSYTCNHTVHAVLFLCVCCLCLFFLFFFVVNSRSEIWFDDVPIDLVDGEVVPREERGRERVVGGGGGGGGGTLSLVTGTDTRFVYETHALTIRVSP